MVRFGRRYLRVGRWREVQLVTSLVVLRSYARPLKALGPAALVFVALLFSSELALAQFSQQGPKLVGTGAVGTAGQGRSVALSSDGNTAIVGGPNDNNNTGAAWVYTRSGGVWTQQAE